MLFSQSFNKIIRLIRGSKIHNTSKVCFPSRVHNSRIDRYTYVGRACLIINSEIGSFTSISDGVFIGGGAHPKNYVSTSPIFYQPKSILGQGFAQHNVQAYDVTQIGSDVWIGAGAHIKSGINIGVGAIIGQNATVTKDVRPYEIIAGTPARLIGSRFSEEFIGQILKTKWWRLPDDQLKYLSRYINDPELFLEKILELKNVK